MNYFRQGDVCIIPIDGPPDKAKGLTPVERDNGRVILQYGEVTGHAHALLEPTVDLFEPGEASELAERFLRIASGTAVLVHEEHAPITLAAGWYEVRRQREYEPGPVNRLVLD